MLKLPYGTTDHQCLLFCVFTTDIAFDSDSDSISLMWKLDKNPWRILVINIPLRAQKCKINFITNESSH